MSDAPLSDLSISELGERLLALGFKRLQFILTENEISGAMLAEITSAEELQSIDSSIKPFEAKGWFKEIQKMKNQSVKVSRQSVECPVCFRMYSEVDPTTLLCGHTLCIDDAQRVTKCPTCSVSIAKDFKYAVNYTIRDLSVASIQMPPVIEPSSEDGHVDTINSDSTEIKTDDLVIPLNNLVLTSYEADANISSVPDETPSVLSAHSLSDNDLSNAAASSAEKNPQQDDINEQDDDEENDPNVTATTVSAKKKNKKKSKKRKPPTKLLPMEEDFLNAFAQVVYNKRKESYQFLLTHAKTGNAYAIAFLDLTASLNECQLIGFDEDEASENWTVIDDLLETSPNDKYALYLCAVRDFRQFYYDPSDPSVLVNVVPRLLKSYELGLTMALVQLGQVYAYGQGVKPDLPKAVRYWHMAIKCDHYIAAVYLAALEENNSNEKMSLLNLAAEKGIVDAYYQMALWEKRADEKKNLMVKAASLGHIHAMIHLAKSGTTRETKWKYYSMAAHEGHFQSLEEAYNMVFNKEFRYTRELAAGLTEEEIRLVQTGMMIGMYECDLVWGDILQHRGQGTEALAMYHKMYEKDSSGLADYRIGQCYEEGVGVPADSAEARRYYSLGALKFNPYACMSLARMYEVLEGDQNQRLALKYYQKAEENGSPDARLSIMRLEGRLLR